MTTRKIRYMIRKAVGAIVKYNDKFLLIHKVKIMDAGDAPIEIEGEWDFPKGGIKLDDLDLKKAILRELKEETGSNQYLIIKEFKEKITFTFPPAIRDKSGYQSQETTMFLVEYVGDINDLNPQDEEIDEIYFISKEEVMKKLHHQEMKDFFLKISSFLD